MKNSEDKRLAKETQRNKLLMVTAINTKESFTELMSDLPQTDIPIIDFPRAFDKNYIVENALKHSGLEQSEICVHIEMPMHFIHVDKFNHLHNGNSFKPIMLDALRNSFYAPYLHGINNEKELLTKLTFLIKNYKVQTLLIFGLEEAGITENHWQNIDEICQVCDFFQLRFIVFTTRIYAKALRHKKQHYMPELKCSFFSCNFVCTKDDFKERLLSDNDYLDSGIKITDEFINDVYDYTHGDIYEAVGIVNFIFMWDINCYSQNESITSDSLKKYIEF